MGETTQSESQAEKVATAASETVAIETAEGGFSWIGYAINAAIALVVVSAALLLYHQFVVIPSKQRVAVVDITEVLELKELQVAVAATSSGATDEDRNLAFGEITKFAGEMERVVAELQNECQCTLLVRAAVLKTKADDLTPLLKERLGMRGVEKKALIDKLRTSNGKEIKPEDKTGEK